MARALYPQGGRVGIFACQNGGKMSWVWARDVYNWVLNFNKKHIRKAKLDSCRQSSRIQKQPCQAMEFSMYAETTCEQGKKNMLFINRQSDV